MLDDAALHGTQGGGFLVRNGAVRAIELLALRQVGLVRGKQGQARVVPHPERIRVQDRIQMAHGRPGTRHAVLQLLEGLDDRREGGFIESGDFAYPRAAALQQLPNSGLDVLGADPRERRQTVLAQKRIFHESLIP